MFGDFLKLAKSTDLFWILFVFLLRLKIEMFFLYLIKK